MLRIELSDILDGVPVYGAVVKLRRDHTLHCGTVLAGQRGAVVDMLGTPTLLMLEGEFRNCQVSVPVAKLRFMGYKRRTFCGYE